MRYMRFFYFSWFLCLIFYGNSIAGDRPPFDNASDRFIEYGGGGGPSVEYIFANYGSINDEADEAGLDKLNNSIFLIGGKGFGYTSKNFRIGGAFYIGSKEAKDSQGGMRTQTDILYHYGGLTLEYVYPLKRFEFIAGGLLGGGFGRIVVSKYESSLDFDGIFNDVGIGESATNFDRKVSGSFWAIKPQVSILYKFNLWIGVELTASYLLAQIPPDELEGAFGDIGSSPTIDLGGFALTISPIFGYLRG